MGGLFTNSKVDLDLEVNDGKIKTLENGIIKFMDKQSENIIKFFQDKKFKKQKIEYTIDSKNGIQTKDDDNATILEDYVIQWTIESSNSSNSTNCQLTLFNIGGFLGANGFLCQISLFYYYFMKIPTEKREEKNILKDIDDCLDYIDKRDISGLYSKWNVILKNKDLNNLKAAKDFLTNLYHNNLKDSIFDKISNNFVKKIWKSLKAKITNFITIILYGLTEKLTIEEYIKEKNRINRKKLMEQIFGKLNLETFAEYNIFIIAIDNDTYSWKNYGVAFCGYPLKGANKSNSFAKRLSENGEDGFNTGNNSDSQNKILYNFYYNIINDIQQFFIRNKEKIDNINKRKGINVEIYIKEISNNIDKLSDKYKNWDAVDNESISQRQKLPSSQTISTELDQESEIENNAISNLGVINNFAYNEKASLKISQHKNDSNNQIFEQIKNQMGEERAREYMKYKRLLMNDNFNSVNERVNQNLITNNSIINGNDYEDRESCKIESHNLVGND